MKKDQISIVGSAIGEEWRSLNQVLLYQTINRR